MASSDEPKSVAIVGAGLVGSLAAVYFAESGWRVRLFEGRSDLRQQSYSRQRSINLALSERGITALKNVHVDLKDVWQSLVPMKGRMIHNLDGALMSQKYGVSGECINSIDRRQLNELLMTAADSHDNVNIFFEHDLLKCDFDAGITVFLDKTSDTEVTFQSDLIIGADGAYSTVRKELMKKVRMNFSQSYIPHGYVELTMLPSDVETEFGDKFKMDNGHLHIWPRKEFMMIALPNPDCSFTCTVFAPFALFDSITTPDQVLEFFEKNFQDAIPLIGKDRLVKEFLENPKGGLVSVECHPYHYEDKVLIIGDAAHAMVPFYGQGMNAGFEDITVLFSLFAKHHLSPDMPTRAFKKTLSMTLSEYTSTRHPDAVAICQLALYNYHEMSTSVLSKTFLMKKYLTNFLHRLMPQRIVPLYTMVSFSNVRYSEVISRWKWQELVLGGLLKCVGIGFVGGRVMKRGLLFTRPSLYSIVLV
ncbi:kynurenine 3-monooxygenase-like protein [Paraphysoderma sedebokerense]|nr:kynurenine 3-monooxygenase-like protein [Paraphysoderma sedebokerense]